MRRLDRSKLCLHRKRRSEGEGACSSLAPPPLTPTLSPAGGEGGSTGFRNSGGSRLGQPLPPAAARVRRFFGNFEHVVGGTRWRGGWLGVPRSRRLGAGLFKDSLGMRRSRHFGAGLLQDPFALAGERDAVLGFGGRRRFGFAGGLGEERLRL